MGQKEVLAVYYFSVLSCTLTGTRIVTSPEVTSRSERSLGARFQVLVFNWLFTPINLSSKTLSMDLQYFTDLRQASSERVINWLKNRSLLANPLHCGGCNQAMTMVERSDVHVDGFQWLV